MKQPMPASGLFASGISIIGDPTVQSRPKKIKTGTATADRIVQNVAQPPAIVQFPWGCSTGLAVAEPAQRDTRRGSAPFFGLSIQVHPHALFIGCHGHQPPSSDHIRLGGLGSHLSCRQHGILEIDIALHDADVHVIHVV